MNNNPTLPQTLDVVTVTLNPAIDQTVVIHHFAANQVNRVVQTAAQPGGKGVNVAAFLADNGYRVGVTGFLGRENDTPFTDLFEHKGIADGFIRIAGQTRTGIKITDPLQRQTTDINFPGQAPSAANLDAFYTQLAASNSPWVVLAGSLPPGVDAGIYRELIGLLKKQGRAVVLDTSGEALQQALEAAPYMIKPNIHELEGLVKQPLHNETDVIAAARMLIAQGMRLVVVSMGKAGACFVNADTVIIARPPQVEVQSTVGAGDAMVAGVVAAHLRKHALADCARLATAFSLDRITRTGVGLSSTAAVDRWQAQVQVVSGA